MALLIIDPGDPVSSRVSKMNIVMAEVTYRRLLCSLKAIGASG